jgi:hypothetical protein
MSRESGRINKRLPKMKHESAQEASSGFLAKPKPKVAPWPVTPPSGPSPGRRGKKILLRLMVAASICVVASWAVFTVKPSWLAEVKGRLPLIGTAVNKRSSARYPSRPVFKVVQPQRTNPLPPATPPIMAERMERPQTSTPGIPPSSPLSAPPSAYPITRPQVLTPGAPGTPSSTPPSSAYPGTRPEVTVPGAPVMSPSIPPPSASPVAGEVQSPSASTSSFSPSKKEDAESDEYLEIATLYAQKGKYQKAEELFQKVAKENPSSAKAHNNLGVVRLKQEKYDMAEREFKEAMRLDPAFVLPYYNLACLYSRKGVNVEALIYLKKALKRDERVKQWVRSDKDFDRLRSDVVFRELVGGSPSKKEGAQKQEATQKLEGTQRQEGVRQPEKKEEIPPQSGPQQQLMPKQEEMQKQETPQGGAQNQGWSQGGAQNQGGSQEGAQNQGGLQGGAQEGAQGGTTQ